jgi:hypothetical protein
LTIVTTVLLVLGVRDIAWAGYILAAIAIVVGVLPLFGG